MRQLFVFIVILLFLPLSPAATTPTLRIISCSPNITEMIFELGAGDQLVGVSTHTDYPLETEDIPKAVDLFSPSLEAMLKLDPDLIFALPSHQKIIEYFNTRPDVKVVVTKEIETFSQINAAFRLVGETLGCSDRVEKLIEQQPPIPRIPAGKNPPTFLFVVGHGPGLSQLFAVGHGTYLNELFERTGARNVVSPDQGKYPVLNKEVLIRLNPDFIVMMIERSADGEKRYARVRQEWSVLSTLRAVREGDFRFLQGNDIMIPGPRAPHYFPVVWKLVWETKPGGVLEVPRNPKAENGELIR